MGTLANIKDPDEMQGLHCLLRFREHSGTEIHHN